VEVTHVSASVETSDHEFTARGFITGNPTIIEIEQRATVGVDEIVAATVEALNSEFGPEPVKLPFQEVVYIATKPTG
jgi:hypothetical protein